MWVSTKKTFNNDLMFFQFLCKDDCYIFHFTNKKQMYAKEVHKSSLASTYSNNLIIEVEVSSVVDFLKNIKDTNNINYNFYSEKCNIKVDMIITLSEGFQPFKLELILELKDADYFYINFTCPLLKLIQLFKKNQENLCDLLQKKDIEIDEYILEGGNIIQKNIKTKTDGTSLDNLFQKELCDESLNLYELYSSPLIEQSNNRCPEEYEVSNTKIDKLENNDDQLTLLKTKNIDHKSLNLSSTTMDNIITHSSSIKRKKPSSLLKNL